MDNKELRKQGLIDIIATRQNPPQYQPTTPREVSAEVQAASPRDNMIQTIREQMSAEDWILMRRTEREIFKIRSLTLANIAAIIMEPGLRDPATNLKDHIRLGLMIWSGTDGEAIIREKMADLNMTK